MKAIVYEYDPRLQVWFISREAEVLNLTDHSISLAVEKSKWWKFWAKKWEWYPINAIGMRFKIIK